MPTASMFLLLRLALASAPPITLRVFSQISIGSCSTHPARGKICSCSTWSTATTEPEWSKIIARVLVVPWSMDRMYVLGIGASVWWVLDVVRTDGGTGVAVARG